MRQQNWGQAAVALTFGLTIGFSLVFGLMAPQPVLADKIKFKYEHNPAKLKPKYAISLAMVQLPNHSYLRERELAAYTRDKTRDEFNRDLLDKKTRQKIQVEYHEMSHDYEMRRNYSLNHQQEDHDHYARMKGFMQYMIRSIFSYQVTESMKKAEKNSEEVRTFVAVQKSVEQVAKGTHSLELSPEVKFGAKTNFPQQEGRLWAKSNYFNATFDFTYGDPWGFDPLTFSNQGPLAYQREAYKVTLDRELPWDLRGIWSYGATSTNVTAALTKRITAHLSAEIAKSRAVDPTQSKLAEGGEETIRLNYGLKF